MKYKEGILKKDKLNFVERLAQSLGITASAKFIYAEPVERDGVTVVPVARVAYGFGGGSGGENENRRGLGGGGGVVVAPVGYIEIKNGETRFCPARDWLTLMPVIAAAIPIIVSGVWGIRRLLRKST